MSEDVNEGDVAPAKQCTMPSCDRRATDPMQSGALCEPHLSGMQSDADAAGDATAENEASYIDDPNFAGTTPAVRAHYRRAQPVYDALAELDGYPTSAVPSNRGWYQFDYENDLDIDELEAGHRIARLADDIRARLRRHRRVRRG